MLATEYVYYNLKIKIKFNSRDAHIYGIRKEIPTFPIFFSWRSQIASLGFASLAFVSLIPSNDSSDECEFVHVCDDQTGIRLMSRSPGFTPCLRLGTSGKNIMKQQTRRFKLPNRYDSNIF